MERHAPPFPARCRTTAMGIMPHRDTEAALRLALSLDIPFWPQLPNTGFYEDMYVQASEGFPGITIDEQNRTMLFDRAKFDEGLGEYSEHMNDPAYFALSPHYSRVYHRFLEKALSGCIAIRGQNIGPVSFGFRVTDADRKPVIYDDDVRSLLFDFFQRKVNAQRSQLLQKNANAFVWLDEPGLGWVFSGLSGYGDTQAATEYNTFLDGLEGLKALHLCANVNLPYLLNLGVGLLSFDCYQMEVIPKGYARAVADFLGRGGIISWGIVPTDGADLAGETPESLVNRLVRNWDVVAENTGLEQKQIAERALIAPARCCLKNVGKNAAGGAAMTEEQLVEKAFGYLGVMSAMLADRFKL